MSVTMSERHQRRRSKVESPCSHRGMRAVTLEEEPRHDERKLKPFVCDDCSSPVLGPSRFTQGQVLAMLVRERAEAH